MDKMTIEEIHNLHSSPNIIYVSMHGDKCIQNFSQKTSRKEITWEV